MLSKPCEKCAQVLPVGELFQVGGLSLCSDCGEMHLAENAAVPRDSIRKERDPTLCVNCGADNGENPWPLLMLAPTCTECTDFFRNRPYPPWVKLSFLMVLVLVVFSLVWNMRFFQAYFEMHASGKALRERKIEEAAAQMHAAAEHVPESQMLQVMDCYEQGILALKNNQNAEALKHFDQCAMLPPDMGVATMRNEAEIGIAFDNKDYDRFLAIAEQIHAQNPAEAVAAAQVASALACKYAVTGEEKYRSQAEEKLKAAKDLGDEALRESHYEERIRHRLETREIIKAEEFMKRFPNGWKPREKH